MYSKASKGITVFIFYVSCGWFLQHWTLSLSIHTKSAHVTNYQCEIWCVNACVADGTHVWSVVAGWLEPEIGGGLYVGQKGGDLKTVHIFINLYTHLISH